MVAKAWYGVHARCQAALDWQLVDLRRPDAACGNGL